MTKIAADHYSDGYTSGFTAGRTRGHADIVELVWAFIREHGTIITAKGETTISVDALFAVIEPKHKR
jgi:hypothetical protein